MRKWLAGVLLVAAGVASARGQAETDYPLRLHVVGSSYAPAQAPGIYAQRLLVEVGGKRLELAGRSDHLLALGDYDAALLPRNKKQPAFDDQAGYRVLMPDGSTETFVLAATGELVGQKR